LRKRIAQPAAPGSAGGVQYTPMDSKVATARGSAAIAAVHAQNKKTALRTLIGPASRSMLTAIYRASGACVIRNVGLCTTALSMLHYNLEQKGEIRMVKAESRAYTSPQQGHVPIRGNECEFS
jgi:hypothetical protein